MALIKCKMCGGDLNLVDTQSVAECEYCGSVQTVPKVDDEKKLNLFTRANRLRIACEFDKAAGVYESIVAEFSKEAEAYWGLLLCKYGIEYVDDPATGKKVPTCHRSSFDSVMDDSNLEQALENADAVARKVYNEEARVIEELRKGIIEVSSKEAPYDIFICYKETAENGDRTLDSVIAQDVYNALTEKGYRVFFSRITLEDKLGQEYEPYIFAALHSAKVMLAFGTDYEYYNAVWVKNEWSRFLQFIAAGEKKTLIPCYKGIDAYDLPKEFARLQAQDMGKVGAIQDLLRGVEKIIPREKATVKETVVIRENQGPSTNPLLKRGFMALEDREWDKADDFFEQVLNHDVECAEAYWGKFLAEAKCSNADAYVAYATSNTTDVRKTKCIACEKDQSRVSKAIRMFEIPNFLTAAEIAKCFEHGQLEYISQTAGHQENLANVMRNLEQNRTLSRAISFASGELAKQLAGVKEDIIKEMKSRVEQAKRADELRVQDIREKYAERLSQAEARVKALYDDRFAQRKESYQKACAFMRTAETVEQYHTAADNFSPLDGYEDSYQLKEECLAKASQMQDAIDAKAEAKRLAQVAEELEAQRRLDERAKKLPKILLLGYAASLLAGTISGSFLVGEDWGPVNLVVGVILHLLITGLPVGLTYLGLRKRARGKEARMVISRILSLFGTSAFSVVLLAGTTTGLTEKDDLSTWLMIASWTASYLLALILPARGKKKT